MARSLFSRMARSLFKFWLACSLCCAAGYAQPWAGILSPTSGAGACTVGGTSAPGACGIDWTQAGIPGGIPSGSWTQSGSTIAATGSDQTTAIQNALNACGTNHFVLLAAGTFRVDGVLTVPSNCALRGAGADQTIVNGHGGSTGGATYPPQIIMIGGPASPGGPSPGTSNDVSITSGATAGSTSIVVSSATNISTSKYLRITDLNDTWVNPNGSEGFCNYCDDYTGTRVRGQIVQVTSVSGTTIGITPALFTAYANTPLASPFTPAAVNAGIENLQVLANHLSCGTATGVCYGGDFGMALTAFCWIRGVEGNYTDGNFVSTAYNFRPQIDNSYFTNSYEHGPGSYDGDVQLSGQTTGALVQNNIIERPHAGVMFELGAAGNVVAYNYSFGGFADGSTTFGAPAFNEHGPHPQFNLMEGNVVSTIDLDSIHGSGSDQTLFRNWSLGTTKLCTTGAGATRATVSCAGGTGAGGVNWAVQYLAAIRIDFLGVNYNAVGNILGSQDRANLYPYNINTASHIPQTSLVNAICGSSPCGSGSRSYDAVSYTYDLGFGEASDDGTGGLSNGAGCLNDTGTYAYPCHSITPSVTFLRHANYDSATGSVSYSGSLTHTLPASFYLSSKPSWFGSTPFPAIGSDVTGGLSDAFGMAYAIPAMVCYQSVMGGTDGSGSPLAFNANTCYGTAAHGPNKVTLTIK